MWVCERQVLDFMTFGPSNIPQMASFQACCLAHQVPTAPGSQRGPAVCGGVEAFAPVARAHAPVPKSAPTPAVSPMASAPQKVTRRAPTVTRAPPTRAATPPRSAR